MPTERIPLVGQITSRNQSTPYTKDQVFKGCFPVTYTNNVLGKRTVYLQKRCGVSTFFTPAAGASCTALWVSPSTSVVVSGFNSGFTSTIYANGTSVGTLSTNYIVGSITETIISGVTFYLIRANNSSAASEGWFLASDSYAVTAYTCDTNATTTISDIKISGVNSVAGLYVGQIVTGADIPANTRIQSINAGAFTAVLTNAATNTTNDMALTKTPVAKIIDADLPTNLVGDFIELSGTVYIATADGKVYGSDLNTIISWTSTNFISSNLYSDVGSGLAKDGDKIIAFGNTSAEWFYNAGNPVGSLLSKTGRSIPIGALSGNSYGKSISSSGSIICWASKSGSSAQIWILDGGSPRKISNPSIEMILNAVRVGSGPVSLHPFHMGGEQFVFVSFHDTSADYNFLYNLSTGIWTDAFFSDAMILHSANERSISASSNPAICLAETSNTNGRIYELGETSFSDVSAAFSVVIQTSRITHGTNRRKFVKSVSLIADTQAGVTVTLEKSDNDYGAFTTLGTFNMGNEEKRITRCDSYKGGRSYRLTHTSTANFRAEALEIEYEVASS